MTGPAAIVIAAATLAHPAGACPPPLDVRMEVVAHLDPLRVVSDIGLADIGELRRRSGQQESHRTLGLYGSILATGIEPGRAVTRPGDWEGIVRATVDLRLTDRRIHIAREAANMTLTACRCGTSPIRWTGSTRSRMPVPEPRDGLIEVEAILDDAP